MNLSNSRELNNNNTNSENENIVTEDEEESEEFVSLRHNNNMKMKTVSANDDTTDTPINNNNYNNNTSNEIVSGDKDKQKRRQGKEEQQEEEFSYGLLSSEQKRSLRCSLDECVTQWGEVRAALELCSIEKAQKAHQKEEQDEHEWQLLSAEKELEIAIRSIREQLAEDMRNRSRIAMRSNSNKNNNARKNNSHITKNENLAIPTTTDNDNKNINNIRKRKSDYGVSQRRDSGRHNNNSNNNNRCSFLYGEACLAGRRDTLEDRCTLAVPLIVPNREESINYKTKITATTTTTTNFNNTNDYDNGLSNRKDILNDNDLRDEMVEVQQEEEEQEEKEEANVWYYFGVFDGHGGTSAADFASKHLHHDLMRCWRHEAKYGMSMRRERENAQRNSNNDTKNGNKDYNHNATTSKAVIDDGEPSSKRMKQEERSIEMANELPGNADIIDSESIVAQRRWIENDIAEARILRRALKKAFERCDNNYLSNAQRSNSPCGTTALVSLISRRSGVTVTANAGDCRAILSVNGVATDISVDHKPNVREERRRIEKKGGCVKNMMGTWRVTRGGNLHDLAPHNRVWLSVSRGIGDLPLKRPIPLVSSEPDVFFNIPPMYNKVETSSKNKEAAKEVIDTALQQINDCDQLAIKEDKMSNLNLLILACDGVYDVLSSQKAVEAALDGLSQGGSLNESASAVVRTAYNNGSEDNLSCIVVMLNMGLSSNFQNSDVCQVIARSARQQLDNIEEGKKNIKRVYQDSIDEYQQNRDISVALEMNWRMNRPQQNNPHDDVEKGQHDAGPDNNQVLSVSVSGFSHQKTVENSGAQAEDDDMFS